MFYSQLVPKSTRTTVNSYQHRKYIERTGNTRHFRKSIVNDESDERYLNHCLKRHNNVLTEKEHKQTTYMAYPEIDGTS